MAWARISRNDHFFYCSNGQQTDLLTVRASFLWIKHSNSQLKGKLLICVLKKCMYIYVACYIRNMANRELTLSICPLKFMFILIIDIDNWSSAGYFWAIYVYLGRCLVGCSTHRCWLSLFVLLYYWLFQISYLEQW